MYGIRKLLPTDTFKYVDLNISKNIGFEQNGNNQITTIISYTIK